MGTQAEASPTRDSSPWGAERKGGQQAEKAKAAGRGDQQAAEATVAVSEGHGAA